MIHVRIVVEVERPSANPNPNLIAGAKLCKLCQFKQLFDDMPIPPERLRAGLEVHGLCLGCSNDIA